MRRTLILCAHGTDDRRGAAMLGGLANAVRREAGDLVIAEACVSGEGPTIGQVVQATSGPRSIVPLFPLTDEEGREAILDAAEGQPMVTVGAPIGPDWVLAEVGVRRLMEAGARPGDEIVLAADRVTDRQAVDDTAQAARLLSAVWGGRVHVGSIGGQDVDLAEAVDVARAYGRRVVIAPYLMAPCAGLDEIKAAGADLVTEPLLDAHAPDRRLVALILARTASRARWTRDNAVSV